MCVQRWYLFRWRKWARNWKFFNQGLTSFNLTMKCSLIFRHVHSVFHYWPTIFLWHFIRLKSIHIFRHRGRILRNTPVPAKLIFLQALVPPMELSNTGLEFLRRYEWVLFTFSIFFKTDGARASYNRFRQRRWIDTQRLQAPLWRSLHQTCVTFIMIYLYHLLFFKLLNRRTWLSIIEVILLHRVSFYCVDVS